MTENNTSQSFGSRMAPVWENATMAAAVVFVAAAAARLIFLSLTGPETTGDGLQYLLLGRNLVEHGIYSLDKAPPFVPSIRRPPGYPFFLGGMSLLGLGSLTAVTIAQSLIDSCTAVAVLALARAVAPPVWALGAGLAYAIHPGPIPYAGLVLSETLFAASLAVGVLAIHRALEKDRLALAALGGLLVGYAALCRPIALLLPLVLAAIVLRARGVSRRRAHAGLLVLASLVAIAPWCVRSSLVAGRFVPIQGSSSESLYGPSRMDAGTKGDAYYAEFATADSPEKVAKLDAVGWRGAIENIWRDPLRFLYVRARDYPRLFVSTFHYFRRGDQPFGEAVAQRNFAGIAYRGLLFVTFSILPLLLGLIGLTRASKSSAALLCAGVWLYIAAIHLPLWTDYRFWLPAVPFLLVTAAEGASQLTPLRRRLQRNAPGAAAT